MYKQTILDKAKYFAEDLQKSYVKAIQKDTRLKKVYNTARKQGLIKTTGCHVPVKGEVTDGSPVLFNRYLHIIREANCKRYNIVLEAVEELKDYLNSVNEIETSITDRLAFYTLKGINLDNIPLVYKDVVSINDNSNEEDITYRGYKTVIWRTSTVARLLFLYKVPYTIIGGLIINPLRKSNNHVI